MNVCGFLEYHEAIFLSHPEPTWTVRRWVVPEGSGGSKIWLHCLPGSRKHYSKSFESVFMMLKDRPFLFLHVPGFIEYTILISSWVHNKTWNGPKQPRTGLGHHKNILKRLRIMFAASSNTMKPCFYPPEQPVSAVPGGSGGVKNVVPW